MILTNLYQFQEFKEVIESNNLNKPLSVSWLFGSGSR